jgi:hypothetical protein
MPAEDCHSCPLRDFARGRQHLSGCGVSTAAASAAVTERVGFRAAYAQVPGFISERSVEFPAGRGTADAASAAGPHPKADGDSHRSQPRAPRVGRVEPPRETRQLGCRFRHAYRTPAGSRDALAGGQLREAESVATTGVSDLVRAAGTVTGRPAHAAQPPVEPTGDCRRAISNNHMSLKPRSG